MLGLLPMELLVHGHIVDYSRQEVLESAPANCTLAEQKNALPDGPGRKDEVGWGGVAALLSTGSNLVKLRGGSVRAW
jgi:hypothetical protein